MASGPIHADRFNLQQATITGTTDANGNLSLVGIPGGAKLVLFAWDGAHVFIPFYYQGAWYTRVQVTDAAGTAFTSQQVSCHVYFIPAY